MLYQSPRSTPRDRGAILPLVLVCSVVLSVVVVSIVAGEGRGRLLGAVDLVTKPFEREDLLRVLWRNLVHGGA